MTMTDYHFSDIINATKKLKEHVESVERENEKLKKGLVGEILPVEVPPWKDFWGVNSSMDEAVFRFLEKNWATPDAARQKLKENYDLSIPIINKNVVAIESNKLVFDNLIRTFEVLGLKKTYRKYKGSSLKYNELDSEWYKEVKTAIPRQEPLTLDSLEKQYRSALSFVDKWEQKLKRDVQMAEQQVAAQEKKLKADRLVGILAQKYNLDITAEPREVLDAILERDKYLRLAYWLERNRGDWNDGPSFAEIGLQDFPVETNNDKQIQAEISYLIEYWSGDGRCFRDCGWNYGRIRDLGDPEVRKDLGALLDSGAVNDY